jgi:peptidoglycan/LPS O-acetylase OafA/YrhL
MKTPQATGTLFTIQALRAFAAAAVVAYHCFYMLVHNGGYTLAVPHIGASGVDLFFVISGFIMIYTSSNAFRQPRASLTFIRRRAIRIVPLYWLYTTVVVLLLAFAPGLFAEVQFDRQHVIFSYLLLLSENSMGTVGTVMQTGWTLCYEAYFYLLFAMLLNLPRKYFLVVSGAVFIAGVTLAALHWSPPVWASVATDPLLFEFYFGAILAFLFLKGHVLPRLFAIAAIVLGISAIFMAGNIDINADRWTRIIYWGLPCCAILFGAISLEQTELKVPKLLSALGDSSYSLYLAHPFIVPALGKAWTALDLSGRMPPAVLFLIAFGCSLAAGHLLHHVIEKPLTRRLSQTWKSPAGQTTSVVALRKGTP